MDSINNTPDPSSEIKFEKKTVEQPILDSALRSKLGSGPQQSAPAGRLDGFKNFYRSNKIYFWAIIAGLAIITVMAVIAFGKKPAPAVMESNVTLTFKDIQETVASGREMVYRVNIENKDEDELVGLKLEAVYPEGFSYVRSMPKAENMSGTEFKVANLLPRQNAVVQVIVKATGGINEEKKAKFKLSYRYKNFNSEFSKETDVTVRMVASDIDLKLEGPKTTNNSQIIVYTLNYQNNSSSDIKNARIKFNYPQGFDYASATPAPDLDNNVWNLSSLAKGGEGTLQIQGTFRSSTPGENKTAEAQFLVLGDKGQYIQQATTNFSTSITSLPLLVSQELESDAAATVVQPGQDLAYKVRFQNNASTAASGVNILVTLDSKALDLSSVRAEANGQVNGNTIQWNASNLSKLENLAPSESGEVSFYVRVKDPATRDSSKNLSIVSSIKIKSNEYDSYFPGNELALKVSSPVSVKASLQHTGGNLPPQVGRFTNYKISLSLVNSSNDYNDAVVTAFVPLGAGGFIDKSFSVAEGGKAQYDSATGKITWNVGRLLAHTGKFSQSRMLEFSVRLNPSSDQVGSSPVLVKDIKFEGKDAYTEKAVTAGADNLATSDLPGDSGYYNGQVID